MRKSTGLIPVFFCAAAMVLLILDSACAARSAAEAAQLCLTALIPGLFPMLVLSSWLSARVTVLRIPRLAALLGVPGGSEGLFLLGLVGGYPAGCAAVTQNVRRGTLASADGQRMLGFCSNCAPAFLFGVLSTVLGDLKQTFVLALIQILSAVTVAAYWPGSSKGRSPAEASPVTFHSAVRQSVSAMGAICAWVVLASVVTGFFRRWLFPFLPDGASVLLTGILELTAGCVSLPGLPEEESRFLAACFLVNFGGLCVLLQLQALAAPAGLSLRVCALQKLFQGLIGTVLGLLWLRAGIWAFAAGMLPLLKKAVEISRPMVYNTPSKGGI